MGVPPTSTRYGDQNERLRLRESGPSPEVASSPEGEPEAPAEEPEPPRGIQIGPSHSTLVALLGLSRPPAGSGFSPITTAPDAATLRVTVGRETEPAEPREAGNGPGRRRTR